MARLFLAVWLPEDATAALREIHRKDQPGVRFVDPDRWHITLRFFGDAHAADVADALAEAQFPPATAVLGPAVDVLDERVLAVPATGLESIVNVVNRHTRQLGTKPPRKRFVGHVTVGRVKDHVPMPRALGTLVHAAFEVTEIALVHSRLGARGSSYETLETWTVPKA